MLPTMVPKIALLFALSAALLPAVTAAGSDYHIGIGMLVAFAESASKSHERDRSLCSRLCRQGGHHRTCSRCQHDGNAANFAAPSAAQVHGHLPPPITAQGYAMLEQIVSGVHTRLYARAYVIADPSQDR